jgi:hypothetical protein
VKTKSGTGPFVYKPRAVGKPQELGETGRIPAGDSRGNSAHSRRGPSSQPAQMRERRFLLF